MKRGRSAPKSKRATKSAKTATKVFPSQNKNQRFFVARSFGTPLAITERKYFDSERTSIAMPSSTTGWAGGEVDPATINTLFAPTQGDDYNNRQGRKVTVLGLKLSGHVGIAPQANATATDNPVIIRLHLVQDTQTNAAQLNAEDVFTSGSASDPINMFQNPAFFGRFRILKSKKFIIQNPNISYDGTNMEQQGLGKMWKINHKFKKPVVVHYNGTNGGTVADCIDHSFHIVGLANNNDLVPLIVYKCRTTFIDA